MEIRRPCPSDHDTLVSIGDGLFDNPVAPAQARAFPADPLHQIPLGFVGGPAGGIAFGGMMLHPEKPPTFFVRQRPGPRPLSPPVAASVPVVAYGCDGALDCAIRTTLRRTCPARASAIA